MLHAVNMYAYLYTYVHDTEMWDVAHDCFWSMWHVAHSRAVDTGWRTPMGCLKLQVIFRKRATNYGALCGKRPVKIRHPMGLRHPVCDTLHFVALYTHEHDKQMWDVAHNCSLQGGEDHQDALSSQVIFRKWARYLAAHLQKMTCDLRHPMSLRHPVDMWHIVHRRSLFT